MKYIDKILLNRGWPLLLTLTVFNGFAIGWNNWAVGATSGMTILSFMDEYFTHQHSPYRRWYLMCRNVLEEIEQTSRDEYASMRARGVLNQIGPRTSKREPWENA